MSLIKCVSEKRDNKLGSYTLLNVNSIFVRRDNVSKGLVCERIRN